MKTKTIPFDLEIAKKIQAGEIEGRIKCNEREFHRILCFDAIGLYPIVALLYDGVDEVAFSFSKNGYFRSSTAMKLFIELPEEASNIIDSKSLYEKWTDIQDSLIELFREKAVKNNVKFSDADLVHYAAELFTWFRETHLIFKFRLDKLEELKQYAEEHIMEPSWCSEAKQNIKKIFGLESPKHEFKPFDKVLVRSGNDDSWEPRLFARYVKYPDKEELYYYTQDDTIYDECIPYEGDQELVGTTKTPKDYEGK